jgi:hypothetical protein
MTIGDLADVLPRVLSMYRTRGMALADVLLMLRELGLSVTEATSVVESALSRGLVVRHDDELVAVRYQHL